MKAITRNFTTAAAALIALIGTNPETRAANLTLDGSGFYELGHKVRHSTEGVSQSGRYSSLTGAYYRRTTIGMEWITNNSRSRSGKLSFEFWGMPYYGATSGVVLMTRSVGALSGGHFYETIERNGHAVFLNEYRFPELNLWEHTRNGWKFRDALSFEQNNLL